MSPGEYRYVALDRRGSKIRGRLQATSAHEAMARLGSEGLTPIQVKTESSGLIASMSWRQSSPRGLAEWLRAIGLLIAAGAPLLSALSMVRQQARGAALRRLTETL